MGFLPPVLSRFAQSYPLVELEIRCDRSRQALDAIEAGEVDLTLVTQPCGRAGGQVVRREPLCWAVARDSMADEHDPVPLAIFAPGCIYREAALGALDASGRAWRHAYNSPSRDGLDVAVAAGLAVTIVAESGLGPGLRPVAPEQGLPPLPEIEIFLFRAPGIASPPIARLAEVIAEMLEIKASRAA